MKNNLFRITLYAFIAFFWACSEEPIEENEFGSLTGKVVANGDNTPLFNVKISTTPVSTTLFTDINGNFQIDEIQVGEYSIQAELGEFKTAFEPANIVEGQTVNVIFELDSVTIANSSPLISNLLFPEDGAEKIVSPIEFVWSSAVSDDDEITYELELRNGATNEIKRFESLTDTTLLVESLEIGNNYFWQVSADDGISSPVKSNISSFSTNIGASNRFLYVRNLEGNNVIFSATNPIGTNDEDLNQNEVQLTSKSMNSFRPIKNTAVDKIAFLRFAGTETHLFTMNSNGVNLTQVTNAVPVSGFRQEALEYVWYDNGAKLYYPHFNKLYSINQDGSGNQLVYEASSTVFISEIAVNPTNNLIAIKTNAADGYNARIVVIDPATETEVNIVSSGLTGALGGLDYSIDGTKILYTRDVSGNENLEYRQLDSRIFEYSLTTNQITEKLTDKPTGTNDLDPKYAPDENAIIFMNTSNDGISEKRIYLSPFDELNKREALFINASMPNWE